MCTLTSLELSIIETGASAYVVNGRVSWVGGDPVRAAVAGLCRRGFVEAIADGIAVVSRATVAGRSAAAQARDAERAQARMMR